MTLQNPLKFNLPETPYNFPEYKVTIKDDEIMRDQDLLTNIFTPRTSAGDFQKFCTPNNEHLRWLENAILHITVTKMILEKFKDRPVDITSTTSNKNV